jgi:hypothetical protein
MNLRTFCKRIGFGVAAVAAPGAALALPPAFYDVGGIYSGVFNYGAGTYDGVGTMLGSTAILTGQPSLTLDGVATAAILDSPYETQWSGEVLFWAEVVGPSASIPLDIAYSETDTVQLPGGGGYADAQSEFVFYDGVDPAVDAGVINQIGNTGSQSASGTYSMNVPANTPFYIAMSAIESMYSLNYTKGVGETASISMDPMMIIDPSFSSMDPNYRKDYSLQFSDGIENIGSLSPVPEPGPLVLIAGGLAMAWRASRRRQA